MERIVLAACLGVAALSGSPLAVSAPPAAVKQSLDPAIQSPAVDEHGFSASDYEDAAKEFEQTGEKDLARHAREKAAKLRKMPATPLRPPTSYEIPGTESTLTLSELWKPISAAQAQKMTDDMLKLRPQTNIKYVAGFDLAAPPAGSGFRNGSITIATNRFDMADTGPATMAAAFHHVPKTGKAEIERYYQRVNVSFRVPHYEARLGAIVFMPLKLRRAVA